MKKKRYTESLEEVHESINTTGKKSGWKRLLAFLGPAYLVSVGYMDPGNWATGIAGGSQFGYKLIWVLVMSNIMAILLQSLCARLGVVRGRDLAQASRETYPAFPNFILYILAEIAIVACDLAEVIGMAVGLNLLFGMPMVWGVCLTALDSFILLFLLNKGMRKMEAFIVALIAIIALSFLIQMFIAEPDVGSIVSGLIPTIPNTKALYIAIGIIGATVMPHNLYLHSSLVQSRKIERTEKGIKQALKYNYLDSTIALNLALFVNAAILILAAAVFYEHGLHNVVEIQDAHKMLEPLLGSRWAPILFALALIAAGQSSTLTGTLAGQIVMEGYLNLRIHPVARRLITRLLAIIPAMIAVIYYGPDSTGELLVLSQVVLSLQLGFAMIPLIHFVSDKKKMNGFHIKWPLQIIVWLITVIIVGLYTQLVINEIQNWLHTVEHPIYIWLGVIPLAIGAVILLLFITVWPWIQKQNGHTVKLVPHIEDISLQELTAMKVYENIAIAIDFSDADEKSIAQAISLGGKSATYTLIHIVETPGARIYGKDINDYESGSDKAFLQSYEKMLAEKGYQVNIELGFGSPKKGISSVIKQGEFDILVIGSHGHRGIKDLLFGTTIDAVRHRVDIPVLIV